MSQGPARSQIRMRTPSDAAAASAPPLLNAAIRRHLGASLRLFYAGLPAEPPGVGITALLAQLDTAAVGSATSA